MVECKICGMLLWESKCNKAHFCKVCQYEKYVTLWKEKEQRNKNKKIQELIEQGCEI